MKDGSRSKSYRVLTEAEHHIIRHTEHNLDAARASVSADKVMTTSGQEFPYGATGANLNVSDMLQLSNVNPLNDAHLYYFLRVLRWRTRHTVL